MARSFPAIGASVTIYLKPSGNPSGRVVSADSIGISIDRADGKVIYAPWYSVHYVLVE